MSRFSLLLRHVHWLAAAGLAVLPAQGNPLSTVAQIRALPHASVAAGQSVRLSGVITYLRDTPADFNFILDDGSGGIMVYPGQRQEALQPGQQVTVEGVTKNARMLSCVNAANFMVGGVMPLPLPLPASLPELVAGKFDGRFVEITDTVRVVRLENPQLKPQRLALDLGPRNRRVTAWISHWAGAEQRFTAGSRVTLRGVVIHWYNERSQPLSTSLLINSPANAVLLPDFPARPPAPLGEVLLGTGSTEAPAPVSTTGILTNYQPGEILFVQDGGRGLRVRPAPADALPLGLGPVQELPRPGQRLVLTGFSVMGDYTTELEDATFQILDEPGLPPPLRFADAAQLLASSSLVDRDAMRVTLPARVRGVRNPDGRTGLDLISEAREITALWPAGFPFPEAVQPGALVQVTGNCTLLLGGEARRLGRPPDSFQVTLAGPPDLTVIQAAPWWSARRLFGVLISLGSVVILTVLWAGWLRRKNTQLRREITAREAAESRLATDRRRVAADLHDTLEQTLVAAHLQLCAASHHAGGTPDTAAPLSLARQLLARGRQEVRDAVWDLHADFATPTPCFVLLAKTCEEAQSVSGIPVFFQADAPERPLPALVTAQCVRLVREAVTNALKHAAPMEIRVTAHFADSTLILTIADDGRGFLPAAAPGPETGHFGLTGMQERLQKLAGTLTVTSQPGHGTTIRADIPLTDP